MAGHHLIKKYANRILYDTEWSCAITRQEICKLIAQGIDVEVRDDRSGVDLTRAVLLQILLEQEQLPNPMLSTSVLRQLIYWHCQPDKHRYQSFFDASLAAPGPVRPTAYLDQSPVLPWLGMETVAPEEAPAVPGSASLAVVIPVPASCAESAPNVSTALKL